MPKKTNILFLFFVLLSFFSCQSEAEKKAERNAVIDSTIVNFEKKLYQTKMDSVFAKNKFNGSISVFQNGEKLYEKQNGFEDFKTSKTVL